MKRCKTCKRPLEEKPRVEVITVEGISYKRYHWSWGMTVDSPCSCFGGYRAHSTHACPWMKQRFGPYPWKKDGVEDPRAARAAAS